MLPVRSVHSRVPGEIQGPPLSCDTLLGLNNEKSAIEQPDGCVDVASVGVMGGLYTELDTVDAQRFAVAEFSHRDRERQGHRVGRRSRAQVVTQTGQAPPDLEFQQ